MGASLGSRARDVLLAVLVVGVAALAFSVREVHAQLNPSPPNAAEVTTGRGAPLRADPTRRTASVGTAIDGMFSADVDSSLAVVNATHLLLVTNRHASNTLCVWFAPTSTAGADCAAKCAAVTATCNAGSGDGSPVLPNTQRSFPTSGELCPCWRASGASTTATAERVARFN